MPATDQATLLAGPNLACYNNLGMQDQQLIKLALLQIIANALNPMAKTDQASLLSDSNVACYRSVGSYPLLELALLQIIANASGSTFGNYAGGTPNFTPATNATAIDTSNGQQWAYYNGAWHQVT